MFPIRSAVWKAAEEEGLCFYASSQNCEKLLLASSCLSVRPHGTTRFPLDGFPRNLIFEYFFRKLVQKIHFFFFQRLYSPGWASASFSSFLHPSRLRATIFQFLHPNLATSSSTPSSQHSLGLPLGLFPPGSLRRTLLDKSSSSWRMTCPAHLSLLSLQNFTMSFSPHSW